MKTLLSLLFILPVAHAELVFKFSDGKWTPEPSAETIEKSTEKQITLIAPAGTKLKNFSLLFTSLAESTIEAIQLKLSDSKSSVTIQPFHTKDFPKDVSFGKSNQVLVFEGKQGFLFAPNNSLIQEAAPTGAHLNFDLSGLENFIKQAKSIYQAKRKPLTIIITRSYSSYAQLVTLLQILDQTGVGASVIVVNDQISSPHDLVVEMDKKITVPVEAIAVEDLSKKRILISITKEGDYRDDKKQLLPKDEDILNYIKKKKGELKDLPGDFILHIRADRKFGFEKTRDIMKIAVREGIKNVRFAPYSEKKSKSP